MAFVVFGYGLQQLLAGASLSLYVVCQCTVGVVQERRLGTQTGKLESVREYLAQAVVQIHELRLQRAVGQ